MPRIYVRDLAAYASGSLVGRWIDLDVARSGKLTVDELREVIQTKVLLPGHEEWAIHDYEGFGPIVIGEYESLETVIGHVQRMGDDPLRYMAWVSACDGDGEGYSPDHVTGPYEDEEDWFYRWLEGYYGTDDLDEILVNHGVRREALERLADVLRFITPEQFKLNMHCNEGIDLVYVPYTAPEEQPGGEYYAVDTPGSPTR